MKLLLTPLTLFAWQPIAVFVVALVFGVLFCFRGYSKRSRWVLGIVTLLWFVYGLWETYMTNWRSSTGDMAIRIDLVICGPILLLAALAGILAAIFAGKRVA